MNAIDLERAKVMQYINILINILLLLQVHEADACLVLANKYCPDPDAEVRTFEKCLHFILSLYAASLK